MKPPKWNEYDCQKSSHGFFINACQPFSAVFILIFITAISPSYIQAESQFDSDDNIIFEENETSVFDSENILFDEEENSSFDSDDDSVYFSDTILETQSKKEPFFLQKILQNDSKYTLGYEFSYGLNLKPNMITNDTYIRQEVQTLLYDNYFFQFDGRFRWMFHNDHRVKAKNKDILTQSNIRELYIQKGFENFSITFGKQIVVWGKADTGIITDVVSPRDNSDFIFIKLEDSRFGQTLLSSSLYTNLGKIFLFVAPEPLTDKEPDEGTQYYIPYINTDYFILEELKPEFSDVEFGFRWEKIFGKTDLSLMTGHFVANTGVYHFFKIDDLSQKPVLQKKFHTYDMFGLAATHAKDRYLFKLEAAFKHKQNLQGLNLPDWVFSIEKNIIDISLGIEYNANDRYLLSAELSHRHIQGNMGDLLFDYKRSTSLYTIFTKDFFNQTANAEYIFYYHIQDHNAFHQIRWTNDFTDNFQMVVSLCFFDIEKEQSLLWFFKDENRLTVDMKYYF
jgi:hypothetical protein